MSLKSRGIFKNFLPVFLLLIVVIAVCVPFKEANAAPEDIFKIGGMVEDWIAKLLLGDNVFMRSIYFIIYQILNMGLLAVTILVYFGSWLVDVFLDEAIYARVLDMTDSTSAVSIGWATVRDACNTFFILFLLVIAFSTILRIQAYNAKSLLPKLIISLFLINFSATIAMMVIDLGQVFMFEIKEWMGAGGFSDAGSPLTSIVDYFNLKYNIGSPTGKFLLEDVVGVAFAVAYSVILGLLYIMLALFLMVRIIVFVILVIISPFAFFSIILPGMRTYTSQWWSSLVSHAIFGPVFLFFIFLSGKMAQSMRGFTSTVNKPDDIDALSFIIAELIPHIVALGMLAAAIPVTQKLGMAGSSKIIGGAAGIGKIAVGTYAGIKLAGGLGKKTGGLTVGRAHSALKGRSKKYNDLASWTGGKLKSAPIGGRIFIKHESDKAERNKEAVSKHEKVMGNLTDKDKKKYVDSFKLDKNAQAEAQQAMFNLMAKDSGKGLTNARLMKMGYEKDTGIKRDKLDDRGNVMLDKKGNVIQESIMKFDKEKFEKDYGRAAAHGMDTTNIETYRPDLIKDKSDRIDKVKKTVADGNEKNIKLDVLLDEDLDEELQELLGKRRYKVLIDGKSQEEKDGLAKGKEDKLIRGMQIHKTNPRDKEALDIISDDGKDELFRQQTEIAYLTGTKNKAGKMRKIKGINNDQSLNYESKVDDKIARNVVNRMDSDDFVDQDSEFLEKMAYMIEDTNQFSRINRNKNVTTEQSEAIKKSISDRARKIDAQSTKTAADQKEYSRLEKAADIMGSSITNPSGGGSSPIAHSEPKSRQPVSKDESVPDSSTESYQRTRNKLDDLARRGGFDQGIEIDDGELGMGAPKEKNGRLIMGSKTIDNLREAFEADKEFVEEGTADMIRHEEQHGKGPALGSSQKMTAELKKYSEQEGVSAKDIKKKEDELKEKYYFGGKEGAGYEAQTEVQRINEAFSKDPKKFVENEARMHVMTDVAYEGMDKMGDIEYGPENSGLHRTHSAFIKEDTIKEITKEMEVMRQDLVAKHEAKKNGEAGNNETNIEGRDELKTATKENKIIKPKEKQTLLHQQVFDKMNDINLKALGSIQEKNKGKDPQEGLKELGNLKSSLSELVNESQDVIKEGDEDLSLIAQGVGGGIETARGILQKRIAKQSKDSPNKAPTIGSEIKGIELKEAPKRSIKPDVKPDKVSIEDLEMKDIKEEYDDRKEWSKAGLGTKQIEIAQRLGNRGDERNNVEVYNKLTKDKEAKRIVLDDKMNDINYKIAEAKQSGGSGADEVKKLFAEKKMMAKKYVEGANPDLMRDIRYEEGKIEQLKTGGRGGERLNRKSQSRRRGTLDQLQKEKQAKVDEVLGGNKGFRERGAIRTEKKIAKMKSDKNYVDISKTPTDKKMETEPQSEKTGVKKAVGSYKKYVDKSPSIVVGKHIKKNIIDPAITTYKEKMPAVEATMGKAEIAGLKAVATVRPTVRVANKVILPILDEGVKASEEKMAGAKISNKEMRSRMAKRLKTEVKPIISKNADKGVDAIGDGAEEALNKAAENATGKTKIVLKTASAVAGNKHVRRAISKKAQRLADQEEGQTIDTKPITKPNTKPGVSPDSDDGVKKNVGIKEQPKPKSVPKQRTIIEAAKPEVVKTEVTSKSNVSVEMSGQIEEALKNISGDMTQNINVGFDSSQGITGLDLKELVDSEKIAKLVKEGIDVKNVEKTLANVKKSFKEFKGNNGRNANTTIFNAGISAAQTALDRALAIKDRDLTLKDRNKRAIEFATIKNVLGEIESGMNKQDKPSTDKEK